MLGQIKKKCEDYNLNDTVFTRYLLDREIIKRTNREFNINDFWERSYEFCDLPLQNITLNGKLDSSYYIAGILKWKSDCSYYRLLNMNQISNNNNSKFIKFIEKPSFTSLSKGYILFFDTEAEQYFFRTKSLNSDLTKLIECDTNVSKEVGDSLFSEFDSFFWDENNFEDLENMQKLGSVVTDSWSIILEGYNHGQRNIIFRYAISTYEPKVAEFHAKLKKLR